MGTYLYVESNNFDFSMYDSQKISCIRGGSYLALDAMKGIETYLKDSRVLGEPISIAASTGLFRLSGDADPTQVRNDVEQWLAKDDRYKFLTFSIATTTVLVNESLDRVRKLLQYEVRCRQMRSPNFVYPSPDAGIDEFDGIRPAATDAKHKPWSEFSQLRRRIGSDLRNDILNPTTEDNDESMAEVVHDLEELADIDADGLGRGMAPTIADKIAVISADGNGFGQHQQNLDDAGVQAFDSVLKEMRDRFIQLLRNDIEAFPMLWEKAGRARVEIITLAGDDLVIIVPAWLGFRTLHWYYKAVKEAKFRKPEQTGIVTEKPLTFSAGIVFCNHKAPITRMLKLAHRLCSFAKEHAPVGVPEGSRPGAEPEPIKGNLVAYQVLESFDHAGTDLEETRKKAYGDWVGSSLTSFLLKGTDLAALASTVESLRNEEDFARKYLFETVRYIVAKGGNLPVADTVTDAREKIILNRMNDQRVALYRKLKDKELDEKALGGGLYAWINLVELWDYLVEVH